MRKASLYLIGVSLTTVVAGTATGLFSLYHFQNYAAYGLLANLVAVPIIGFIVMPFIVLCYFFLAVGAESIVLPIIEWGVGWVMATAYWVSSLDGAVWHMASFPKWIFIGIVICLWWGVIVKGRAKLFSLPVLLILIALIPFQRQADIQIARQLDLIAVRDDGQNLWFSTGRKERFVADNWQRLNGRADDKKLIWPKEGSFGDFPLRCDYDACRGEINGRKVCITKTKQGILEDCLWADLLISKEPVRDKGCNANHVIDRFDIWRKGAQAIWLSPNKIEVKTVEGQRGKRPWAQISANRKSKL